jgi:protein tyrosine/serine phosphatase
MLHVPLEHSSDPDEAVADVIPKGVTSLSDLYIAYLENSASGIAAIYAILASLRTLPALVHCAAGKDRTGLVAALVLSSLGVDDDVIAQDYEETSANIPSLIAHLEIVDPQASDHLRHLDPVILSAQGDTLLLVLDWIRSVHGSVDAFVRRCGVPDEDVAVLRHRLLAS